MSRKLVEERCLAGLKDELLTPENVERITQRATRLLAARNCERQPELEYTKGQVAKVESEIVNIMKAIKAGILTASTKAELEKAEAEQRRLQEAITRRETTTDKVTTLLPGAQERIRAVVNDLASLSQKRVAQARNSFGNCWGKFGSLPWQTATWKRC